MGSLDKTDNGRASESGVVHLTTWQRLVPTDRVLHKAVWHIAWPSVITMMLQTLNALMDTAFVGHLPYSQQALAATGIGGQAFFLLISLAMGISVGSAALVARFVGAQERDNAVRAAAASSRPEITSAVRCSVRIVAG